MDCSLPGSSVRGISQGRILERVAISSSRGSFQLRDWIPVSYISCTGMWVLYHYCHLRKPIHQVSSVQSLSCVWLFATPWTAAYQASLSITNSQTCSNSCLSGQWCLPTISSSVIPFFSLQYLPASGSFPMSQFFASGGQSIGASASVSVLPMNIQDWFPLGLTGWISTVQGTLQSLQHYSSKASILWRSAFFMVQLSHAYMTTGKIIALTRWTFVSPRRRPLQPTPIFLLGEFWALLY